MKEDMGFLEFFLFVFWIRLLLGHDSLPKRKKKGKKKGKKRRRKDLGKF